MKNPVLERLQRYGIQPRKDLGQHFLIDQNVLGVIARSIDAQPGECIVEFGPGIGVLTETMLDAGAQVVGVELDDAMAELLRGELGGRDGFELVHADLARVDLQPWITKAPGGKVKLVGNLPYQLTSHVLFTVLGLQAHLRAGVFLVQREVAERIAASPGSKQFGILSVLLQAYYDVRIEQRVKPGSFAPPPRVESALLRLDPLAQPALAWEHCSALTTLVKSVFNERRKVLRNTLKKFYELDADGLEAVARSSGIDLGLRPEALPVADFVRLLHAVSPVPSSGSET